ncbi:MAG: hypothetical protein WEB04_10295 [Dehalococcoidia bacterium]
MPSTNHDQIVGIMGMGVVGDAVQHFFERQGRNLRVYDPDRGLGTTDSINEADIVFLCVPTPFMPEKGFDDSALENAVSLLSGPKIVVITSTVLPGTTEAYQCRYSQHCFLFNPEFLRESYARTDFMRPDRQILGYTAQSRHLVESIMNMLPAAPYTRSMGSREAELSTYMTNAFLALKVTFANEIYDLASAIDADYDLVREAVAADLRIGSSHLDVLEGGYRGYGGKRLPKDTKALLELGDRIGVPMRLLRTADRINASLLPPGDDAAPLYIVPPFLNITEETDDGEVAA